MDVVERLTCNCNPTFIYRSRASFKSHTKSNRHRAWYLEQENMELRIRLGTLEQECTRLRNDIVTLAHVAGSIYTQD